MNLNKTINLIKEMLDITLDLQLFYIQDFKSNINNLKTTLPSMLSINNDYFDNFIDLIANSKFKSIYSIVDPAFGNYIIICLDDMSKDYIILGPYIHMKYSDETPLMESDYNFTNSEIDALKKYYKSIPVISKFKMTNILKTLLKSIFSEDCKFEYIERKNLKTLKHINNKSSDSLVKFLESQSLETIAVTEYTLFLAVREGDKFLASKCIDKLLSYTNINLNKLDKIRDYKNKLMYYNTLLKKATELESVPITYLASLYNTYLSRIEHSNDYSSLHKLLSQMVLDYCNIVTQYKLKGYSPVVKKVMNYILLNIQHELTVQHIANLFYVSPTYLSKLFKKEANCSVIEYINRQRIKRSTYLLKDTALPVHHISSSVGIDDLNYFSRLFKKYMKVTPSQYRKDNTYVKRS